ncbi:MAG: hypothetical protein IPH44_30300 [Myxococcales bacterium]|nr:hypothetical protein [Myxococcales bacterium]MBP6849683.1 hypothetical protein [Kofleriaceae bacterium]
MIPSSTPPPPGPATSEAAWVPYVHRGYYDVPLHVVTIVDGVRYVLACAFDDARDAYDDRYQVSRGAAAPLDAPWEGLIDPASLAPAGWLAVAALRFDHKRKRLDGAALVAGLTPAR